MPRSVTPSLFPASEVLPAPLGRDEMNFAEFPLAVLTARAPKDCTELVFADTYTHKGETRERRLTVTAVPKYGLPTVKDEEVLLGLLAMTKQRNNLTAPTVETSRYELIRFLGWNLEGHSYQRLTEALDCWASVYLKYENAWWDNDRKEHIDVAFHVIDQWAQSRPENGGRGGRLVVRWNEVAFRSFQSNYVKQLDLKFYQSLESAVTKRLFRFLDKHLYHKPHRREFDLADLAYVHVGIARSSPLWKAKQAIESAVSELEERNYLAKLPASERFSKLGRGKYSVLFTKQVELTKAVAEEPKVEVAPLVAELVSRGITDKSAVLLVGKHSAEDLALQLEAFDWLMKRKDKRVSASPPGYLFKSIEEKYPLPHGFTPASVLKREAERKEKLNLETTRKQREEAAKAKSEKLQAEERRARVEAYLRTLPAEKRKRFEADALANGPAELVEAYRKALSMGLTTFAELNRYQLLEHAMTKPGTGAGAISA